MAIEQDRYQKICVFHECDGMTYSLIFADSDTGLERVSITMPIGEVHKFVATILATAQEGRTAA